jgi:hypothetical protein
MMNSDGFSPAVSIVAATDLSSVRHVQPFDTLIVSPGTYTQRMSSVLTGDEIASVSLCIHCKRQKQTVSCLSRHMHILSAETRDIPCDGSRFDGGYSPVFEWCATGHRLLSRGVPNLPLLLQRLISLGHLVTAC